MKKTLAIVLSVLFTVSLICGMFIMTSSAATVVDSGELSDTVSWSVDDTNTLTITGTGAMPDYASENDRPYQQYASTVTSIVIEDGITVVGRQTFSNFSAVKTISMTDSVTTLNGDCFAYCGTIDLIKLSKNVTTMGQGTVWATSIKQVSCYYSWKVLNANMVSIAVYNNAYANAEWIDVVVENILVDPASGTINNSISWNLEADGTFTVSGTGAIPDYENGADRPYAEYVGNIVKLVVEDGITRIGKRAFTGLSICDSVTLPDSVTELGMDSFSVSTIGYIKLPSTLKKIEQGAFYVSTVGTVSCYYDYLALTERLTTLGPYNTAIESAEWVDVVVKWSPLTLGRYGTGFENWSEQTQLLFSPRINGTYTSSDYSLDTVWTLTFSDGTTSRTVNIKPSTHAPQGDWGILRFQPCCEPENNRFVPQTNVAYTITATVTIGGVTYTTTSKETYVLKNVEAIVPVDKDEREYMFSQSSFGAFESWVNSGNTTDVNGNKVVDAQTQMLVMIRDAFGKDASAECYNWIYTFTIKNTATGQTSVHEGIKPSSKIFDNQLRFEPCLWATPFVPQKDITYEIGVEAYSDGELVAYGSYTATSPVDGIEHTEHFAKRTEQLSAPTCTEAGSFKWYCPCGYVGTTEIPAIGHTEETIPGTPATCTAAGQTEGTKCSVCGEILVAPTVIPATGHSWTLSDTIDATCEADGKHCYECSECHETKEEVIPALGHNYERALVPATFAAAGKLTKTCSKCGDVVEIVLPRIESEQMPVRYKTMWDYIAYEEDLQVGPTAEAPEGWLDGTDNATWFTARGSIGAKSWGNWTTSIGYQYYSMFARKTFTIKDASKVSALTLYFLYDENPTVYINGTEVLTLTGYDTGYAKFDLSAYVDLLKDGTNYLCIKHTNVEGGGGFDAALVVSVGTNTTQGVDKGVVWEFAHIGGDSTADAPEGFIEGLDVADTLKGVAPFGIPAYNGNHDTHTILNSSTHTTFFRTYFNVTDAASVTSLVLNIKYDEDPVVYINGVKVWEETGYKDQEYIRVDLTAFADLLVDATEGINCIAVKICNAATGGGSVFDASLIWNTYYTEEGYVAGTASSHGFANFGSVNDPSNILDGNQNTVCGGGYNSGADQYVRLDFKKVEMISEIFVQCKDEGTTTNEDGTRGTYDIYAVLNGVETLIAKDVPAITGTDGGYTVTLDTPVEADAVIVRITSWQCNTWACVADLKVSPATSSEYPLHNVAWTVTKEATCTEKGEKVLKCTVCGTIFETEEIETIAHTPAEAVIENVVDATCTEAGSYDEVVYCSHCHTELSRETTTTEALGHDFGEFEITKRPTFTEAGVKTACCTHCDATTTEESAKAELVIYDDILTGTKLFEGDSAEKKYVTVIGTIKGADVDLGCVDNLKITLEFYQNGEVVKTKTVAVTSIYTTLTNIATTNAMTSAAQDLLLIDASYIFAFQIKGIPAGDYTVVATLEGIANDESVASVTKDFAVTVEKDADDVNVTIKESTLTFPDGNSKKTSSYTETWSATADDEKVYTLVNFNNNNNGWSYIKCGRKSSASIATISTEFASKVTSISLTIDSIDSTKVNSIELKINDSETAVVSYTGNAVKEGVLKFDIPEDCQAVNQTYVIAIDCQESSNGFVSISEITTTYLDTTTVAEKLQAEIDALDITAIADGDVLPSNGTTYTDVTFDWYSSDTSIAEIIDNTVTVKATDDTTVTIYATVALGEATEQIELTVAVKSKATELDPVTIDFTKQGYANAAEVTSVESDSVTITFDKGSNSNTPKYYTSGTAIRAYGGNTITVTVPSDYKIKEITFTFGSSDGSNAITADVGTFNSPNWTGESNSVVFTIGGSSGNRRISSITVTFA